MSEPRIAFFYGDAYHCERAIAAREEKIAAGASVERITRFGDELDIKALAIELSSGSLFSRRRHFLLRHAEAVKPTKSLHPLLDLPFSPGTYLTLVAAEGIDHLEKRVRKQSGVVHGFPRPRGRAWERAAAALLKEMGLRLPPRAAAALAARAGGELLFLQEEARKLAVYAQAQELTEEEVASLAYSGGEESIYPFLDLVGRRELSGALAALGQLHVDPNRLFPSLLHHLVRLTEVRFLQEGGLSPQRIGAELGVPEWLARRLAAQARNYARDELAAALSHGIALDREIKRGGVRPRDALLRLVLVTSRPRR